MRRLLALPILSWTTRWVSTRTETHTHSRFVEVRTGVVVVEAVVAADSDG
jgi:hypothetical protein